MKWKNIYPLLVLHLGVAPWSFMEMQYPWLNLVHYIRFVENYLGLFGVNQTLVGWLKINVTSCSLIFTNSEKSFQNERVSRQKNRFKKKRSFFIICKIYYWTCFFLLITLRCQMGHWDIRVKVSAKFRVAFRRGGYI